MPKVRAYGADATLLAGRETSYGVLPATGWRSLDFKSTDLSSSQPLGEDPLLGRGCNSQDPYRGLISDEGQLEIPLDLRGTGFWLTALFGDPATAAVAATGSIVFSAQPAANSTITINGVAWTFVSGTPTGNQIQIGGALGATLINAAAALNGSAASQVAAATYGTSGGTTLGSKGFPHAKAVPLESLVTYGGAALLDEVVLKAQALNRQLHCCRFFESNLSADMSSFQKPVIFFSSIFVRALNSIMKASVVRTTQRIQSALMLFMVTKSAPRSRKGLTS